MARRVRHMGERLIEADNGVGWSRERASVASVSSGRYTTEIFGVRYELEKRRRSRVEPGSDTGWHLYSLNNTYFFGEFCGSTLMEAVDEASEVIIKADLRGPGYEKEGTG
jgi:hypothetical protein